MRQLFKKDKGEEHNFWMSYTDLLSGFLIVFIIIGVVAYKNLSKTREEYDKLCKILKIENPDSLKNYISSLEEVVDSINKSNLKNRIYEYNEIFTSTKDINVVFDSIRGSIKLTHADPDSDLFTPGQHDIKFPLKEYLEERYLAIVKKTMEINESNNNVELRIEGHTDPTWGGEERGSDYSFIENLTLSSNRANSVYKYILFGNLLDDKEREFVKKNMISVGYSFSDRVQRGNMDDTSQDPASRRIEFRIISK